MSETVGIAPDGFRLPAGTLLGRVRLQVADLERSLDYYSRVIGLQAVATSGVYATLRSNGGSDVLVELFERPGAKPIPAMGRLGLYHFALLLPDRAALARFARHVGNEGERVGASDHLVSEAFYLQDPDGLGIEVYADRPRSSWQAQEGQLVMDTRPLDMRGLLAEAGDQPWDGVPAETRIGHVHLHVGTIPQASDFYHQALGLAATVWSYPGALFLSAGGYHHHLGVNTWAEQAVPAGPDDAKLLDWEVVLPNKTDVEGAVTSLEEHGYRGNEDDGAHRVSDPWGIDLRITSADK